MAKINEEGKYVLSNEELKGLVKMSTPSKLLFGTAAICFAAGGFLLGMDFQNITSDQNEKDDILELSCPRQQNIPEQIFTINNQDYVLNCDNDKPELVAIEQYISDYTK